MLVPCQCPSSPGGHPRIFCSRHLLCRYLSHSEGTQTRVVCILINVSWQCRLISALFFSIHQFVPLQRGNVGYWTYSNLKHCIHQPWTMVLAIYTSETFRPRSTEQCQCASQYLPDTLGSIWVYQFQSEDRELRSALLKYTQTESYSLKSTIPWLASSSSVGTQLGSGSEPYRIWPL